MVESQDVSRLELVQDYICSRPDAQDLVGPGIARIEACFLTSMDSNMHQRRVDILISRIDGTAARIHPSQAKHGKAVYGFRDQWISPLEPDAAPAATRGQMQLSHSADTRSFQSLHQTDVIGRTQAGAFLQESLTFWTGLPHPRGRFYHHLFDGQQFPWHLYLNSKPWGRVLCPNVTRFACCWLNAP